MTPHTYSLSSRERSVTAKDVRLLQEMLGATFDELYEDALERGQANLDDEMRCELRCDLCRQVEQSLLSQENIILEPFYDASQKLQGIIDCLMRVFLTEGRMR